MYGIETRMKAKVAGDVIQPTDENEGGGL